MPTISDFAHEYALYLWRHRRSPSVVPDLVKKIKSLYHTESGEPLNESDISKLLQKMESFFSEEENDDDEIIVEAEDSRVFIKMIQIIRKETKKR